LPDTSGGTWRGRDERTSIQIISVYVNCVFASSAFGIAGFILQGVLKALRERDVKVKVSTRGQSAGETFLALNQILEDHDAYLILILDEVGSYVEDRRDGPKTLYMLSRWREVTSNPDAKVRLSLMYISKGLDWLKRLDTSTLNTLGTTTISLSEYSDSQLKEILTRRAEEAFRSGAVSCEVLRFITDLALAYRGGARYAMELLWHAGKTAEGRDSVLPEDVRIAHARSYRANGAYCDPTLLPLHKQLLLLALASTLPRSMEPYTSLKEAYGNYQVQCESYGIHSEDEGKIRDYLEELERDGLVLLKPNGEALVGSELPMGDLAESLEGSLKEWYRDA